MTAQPDSNPPSSAAPATDSAAAPAPTDDTTAPVAADNALPEGVVISAPYELHLDHVITNSDGLVRRQVSYQYPGADFAGASKTIEAAFEAAGFKPRAPRTQPNGDTVLTFDKGKAGTAYAILKPASADPSEPRALMLDFPASK
ncbi:MAG: hypothetical protein ABI748_06910 [Dokdonella sp.]